MELLDPQSLEQYRHGVNPLKLLVCKCLKDVKFRPEMAEEIGVFKSLRFSVPAVITTNYDTVLEMLFDNEFKVFNDIDDYYGPNSFGIGEIYKIHGTLNSPRSIVLTEKDYSNFLYRSPIVSSKILSLLCEHPLVIMGYSMDDKVFKDLVISLLTSFSPEKTASICKNIVCLAYREENVPQEGTLRVETTSDTFDINTVYLKDFMPVLKDLSRYRMSFSVRQIRMLRKMMVDVSLSPDPNNDPRLAFAGIEGIDEVDPDRTVIALSSRVYVDASKSFMSFSIDDVIADVLNGQRMPAGPMVDQWFEQNKQGIRVFFPIFGYLS